MEGKIIIITAPSGAGKTSIVRAVLQQLPQLAFSISATTRAKRGNEENGKDYYFLNPAVFMQHIHDNDFIEWEMVYEGKYYGTLKSELERIWQNNQVPILDIDVKGAIHVQQQFIEQSLSIFIEPPSVEELQKRLESRGTETAEMIATRINKAQYEISFKQHFNHVVVNKELSVATTTVIQHIKQFLSK
jgi:guanylate kinase